MLVKGAMVRSTISPGFLQIVLRRKFHRFALREFRLMRPWLKGSRLLRNGLALGQEQGVRRTRIDGDRPSRPFAEC